MLSPTRKDPPTPVVGFRFITKSDVTAVLFQAYDVPSQLKGDFVKFVFVVKYGKKFVRLDPENVIVFTVGVPLMFTSRPEHGRKFISPSRSISTSPEVVDAAHGRVNR